MLSLAVSFCAHLNVRNEKRKYKHNSKDLRFAATADAPRGWLYLRLAGFWKHIDQLFRYIKFMIAITLSIWCAGFEESGSGSVETQLFCNAFLKGLQGGTSTPRARTGGEYCAILKGHRKDSKVPDIKHVEIALVYGKTYVFNLHMVNGTKGPTSESEDIGFPKCFMI